MFIIYSYFYYFINEATCICIRKLPFHLLSFLPRIPYLDVELPPDFMYVLNYLWFSYRTISPKKSEYETYRKKILLINCSKILILVSIALECSDSVFFFTSGVVFNANFYFFAYQIVVI